MVLLSICRNKLAKLKFLFQTSSFLSRKGKKKPQKIFLSFSEKCIGLFFASTTKIFYVSNRVQNFESIPFQMSNKEWSKLINWISLRINIQIFWIEIILLGMSDVWVQTSGLKNCFRCIWTISKQTLSQSSSYLGSLLKRCWVVFKKFHDKFWYNFNIH